MRLPSYWYLLWNRFKKLQMGEVTKFYIVLGRRLGWKSPEQLSLMLIAGTRNFQLKQVRSGTIAEKMVPRWPWLEALPPGPRREAWGAKQPQGTWDLTLAWGDPLIASPDPRWASTASRGKRGNQVPHCSGGKAQGHLTEMGWGEVMGRKCLLRVVLLCICCLQIPNVSPDYQLQENL